MPVIKRIGIPLVVILGVLASIGGWLSILSQKGHSHLIASLEVSFPWIILIGGILFSFQIGLLLRLKKENLEREKSLKALEQNYKKELAEKIHAEESKQHLEKALLQGQKLQAMGTLAGGIAHDFNNVLYAIKGYVEMARDDVGTESAVYHNLGKVLEACHRAQELVARILTFSRRQHHELDVLPLKSSIESALSLLRPTVPSSVIIQFIAPHEDNCIILGNQTQLHQVIVNMINNAVDAMDGEGKVTIKLAKVSENDPILEQFPRIKDKTYCKIEISDTGHGMDQATTERIFEPFFTTKEVGKGTGLGLSTVHAIIEEKKGEILVTSQLGHGTTFTILFPEYIADEKDKGV